MTAMSEGTGEQERAVADANAAFYSAFETRDLDAMADVWERTDRATVTHPGWPTLRGWPKVVASWDAIFAGTPWIQFVLTDVQVEVDGDSAWVTLDENILQTAGVTREDDVPLDAARVAATNVFARADGRWRMVVHHGSPVAANGGRA